MEKRISAEEVCRVVGEELGIERSCVRPCLDESDSRVCCLVGLCVSVWRDFPWNVKVNNILRFQFSAFRKKLFRFLCSLENDSVSLGKTSHNNALREIS